MKKWGFLRIGGEMLTFVVAEGEVGFLDLHFGLESLLFGDVDAFDLLDLLGLGVGNAAESVGVGEEHD
jgi:hypothetical protein